MQFKNLIAVGAVCSVAIAAPLGAATGDSTGDSIFAFHGDMDPTTGEWTGTLDGTTPDILRKIEAIDGEDSAAKTIMDVSRSTEKRDGVNFHKDFHKVKDHFDKWLAKIFPDVNERTRRSFSPEISTSLPVERDTVVPIVGLDSNVVQVGPVTD